MRKGEKKMRISPDSMKGIIKKLVEFN